MGDLAQAEKSRDTLRAFYASLKTLAGAGQIHAILVTGITRIPWGSSSSSSDKLKDLALVPKFNSVGGFTIGEFEEHFSDYLP